MRKNFEMKKLYYSISEVSKITGLEQYVLRYWETEFDLLKPAKNSSGNRIYTNRDIRLILEIKKLLREEKYTIEGAKKLLKNYNPKDENGKSEGEEKTEPASVPVPQQELQHDETPSTPAPVQVQKQIPPALKQDLLEMKRFLQSLLSEFDD